MRLEIKLSCIMFPLIILGMFLQLDWSPPVEIQKLIVHVWTKPSYEIEGIVRRAPRQDCVEAQIWGRVTKHFCTIEGPQEKFGTTNTLPRAGRLAKLSNQGRRALVREVAKNPMVPLTECNSVASVPPLAATWAQTRDTLHTSTTASHEASLPATALAEQGNNNFKVSERVMSLIEPPLARTPLTS